jgi:hypothetical protein
MANIPSNVILIWGGTHASIPDEWARETGLDDKFPKGHGAESPNTNGGSATHTHTATTHSHTMASHAHNVTVNYDTESSGESDPGGSGTAAHHHGTSSIAGLSGGTTSSNVVTWSSVNSEPPYYKVIFIKPSSTSATMKAGILAHYNGATPPAGWNYCDGNNSTPDLRSKYLKGASTGADAGTTGGATSHVHTVTHNHTGTSHSHSDTSHGVTDSNGDRQALNWGQPHVQAQMSHTHTYYLGGVTDTIGNYTNAAAGGDTIDLAYKKLGVIKCATPSLAIGLVGLWLGSVGSIPLGWAVCDGTNGTLDLRDKFLKIGADLTENDSTGGSNTHSHTSISHTHSGTSHSHSLSMSGPSSSGPHDGGGGNGWSNSTHTHPANSVSSTTPTYANADLDGPSVDHQPAYKVVAYIQLQTISSISKVSSVVYDLIKKAEGLAISSIKTIGGVA